MVLGVMLPSYVGYLVDQRYGTGYGFFLLGFVLGIAHGVRAISRMMKSWRRDVEEAERREKEERRKYYEDRDLPK
jgi:F0F1-type ATP synthase assembly protein I